MFFSGRSNSTTNTPSLISFQTGGSQGRPAQCHDMVSVTFERCQLRSALITRLGSAGDMNMLLAECGCLGFKMRR
jgi:hypothetical protein